MVLASRAEYQDPGAFRISVDVALVVLHATVTDRHGGAVSNLSAHDFAVYEDGVPQSIRLFKSEDIPVTVGLVVDHSTTMQPKLSEVTAAAMSFVRSSNSQDEMFVVNFNEKVMLGLPGTVRFTNSATELERAIVRVPTQGQTALYDAIAKGLEELQAGTRDKKAMIVVSDGGDNASVRTEAQVMKLAEQSSAVVYTVGLFDENDPDRNPGVLNRLARVTGGEAFLPDQPSEVVGICERIARDIRSQYTIGYVPIKPARDGAYRAIRVHAGLKDHEGLHVRTRTGYIASGGPRSDEKGSK
jgi:VWFA-related protein